MLVNFFSKEHRTSNIQRPTSNERHCCEQVQALLVYKPQGAALGCYILVWAICYAHCFILLAIING